jgi:hypothetical protein
MKFLRRGKQRTPGEYPERFTRAFVQQTLPSATPAEQQRTVEHLRGKGWSEEKLAQHVLPYLPPEQPDLVVGGRLEAAAMPAQISRQWLVETLPALTPRQIQAVVEELERRGWSARDAAVAVLPHLLPKLSDEHAHGILAGLGRFGVSADEVVRLTAG